MVVGAASGAWLLRTASPHMYMLGIVALTAIRWGPRTALGAVSADWLLRTTILLAQQPEDNLGHRAGAVGFGGAIDTLSLAHVPLMDVQALSRQSTSTLDQPAGCMAGDLCENTVEALTSLIRQDNAGQLPEGALAYVEFDVHVSRACTKLWSTVRSLSQVLLCSSH